MLEDQMEENLNDSVDINDYAKSAYLDYAMSVLKGRAIPAIEDGLKPVHRRILYAMHDMGLVPNAKHVKSARVVGEVLGKYHPHGDTSAYDASVRLSQEFKMRYPLIEGQGNFGSRDGDGAAAMRYTEMRLSPISELVLSEIDRGTVDFRNNYDGVFKEPVLLPARLPMLLLNGTSGIAVGMATSMPSHNLVEVGNAVLAHLSGEDPIPHITGPDFPDGGQIISSYEDIGNIYKTGRGSVRLRARWTVETMARGQWRIIVNELPQDVSAEEIMSQIDGILNPKIKKNKKALDHDQIMLRQMLLSLVDGAKNESGQHIRLIFEPKSSKVNPDEMMAFLLANTSLESNFSVNMVCVDSTGTPCQKNLFQLIDEWVAFRIKTVTRRCQFDLDKINKRIHILEGRMMAFLHIEEVIKIIRESDEPKPALIENFSLTEIQAEDILEIRLRQLARLEGFKIEGDIKDLKAEADGLNKILGSDNELRKQIKKEVNADIKKFGDERKTLIEPVQKKTVSTAFVVDDPVTIFLSKNGWIRSRNGHGFSKENINWKMGDEEMAVMETRTVKHIGIIDSNGRAYSINVSDIPGGKGDGIPVTTLIELQAGAKIAHAFTDEPDNEYLFYGQKGYGFIAPFSSLIGRQKAGKTFMKLDAGEPPMAPVAIYSNTHIGIIGDGRLLVFGIDEINKLPSGGKGVILMDAEKIESASPFLLGDGFMVTIKGKDRILHGEELERFVLKRARKGAQIANAGSGSKSSSDKGQRSLKF